MKITRLTVRGVKVDMEDGTIAEFVLAEGSDGSRWVAADLLGMGWDQLKVLARETPGCLLRHAGTGSVLVDMEALMARCETPEAVKDITSTVGELFAAARPNPSLN
jgi:hypothetical protein